MDDIVQDDNGWDDNVARFHSKVAFPDFFRESTAAWWTDEIDRFHNDLFKNGKIRRKPLGSPFGVKCDFLQSIQQIDHF